MKTLWRDFWFRPASAFNLGVVRFCIGCGGSLFFLFIRDRHPDGFYDVWDPVSFYRLLPGPLDPSWLEPIRGAWLFFAFLAGLGIAFPVTIWLGFLSGLFFLGYSYCFGHVYHSTHIYVMALGILAFSKAGDGFRWGGGNSERRADYRWPVQLIKVYVVYVFFACGVQKLLQNGVSWALSDSFYFRLMTIPDQPPLSQWIQSQPGFVSQIFASGALFVVELGAPFALLGRRAGMVFALIWSLFHVLVKATFGVHTLFFSQIFVYSAFIDWEALLARFPSAQIRWRRIRR